jgi:hypothetical protein
MQLQRKIQALSMTSEKKEEGKKQEEKPEVKDVQVSETPAS